MSAPRFVILTEDVIDAMHIGQAVQEAEHDAIVNHHPFCPPGLIILIDQQAATDFSGPPPFPVVFGE